MDASPVDEPGVQVSQTEDYMPAMRAEAKRMKELLEKKFPDLNGYFKTGSCHHDFGTYLEIRFVYDDDEEGIAEANFVENHYPRTWDDTEVMKLYTPA